MCDAIHGYWWHHPKAHNYLNHPQRSAFLLALVQKHVPRRNVRILEVGCNVGRNLNALWQAGYHNLEGVELNARALAIMADTYPHMTQGSIIHVGLAETILPTLQPHAYDLVVSMAFLSHLPASQDGERAVRLLPRLGQKILTIDDEERADERHVPRDYRAIFVALGMEQIEEPACNHIEGFERGYRCRVFRRKACVGS